MIEMSTVCICVCSLAGAAAGAAGRVACGGAWSWMTDESRSWSVWARESSNGVVHNGEGVCNRSIVVSNGAREEFSKTAVTSE